MKVGIVNFGGQYNHLIYRRVLEQGVEAELFSPEVPAEDIDRSYDCVIVSGGPQNIPEDIARMGTIPRYIPNTYKPILGICLGHQLISYLYGGEIGSGSEFGVSIVYVDHEDHILKGLKPKIRAWESHNRSVINPPRDFDVLARSDKIRVQALAHRRKPIYTVQFHPEVTHTEKGDLVFRNFIAVCRR